MLLCKSWRVFYVDICGCTNRYPSIISSCVTNNWVLTTMKAQIKFAYKYELFRTNTIILQASDDIFVHNRAQDVFAQKAPNCRILEVPDSYHEVNCVAVIV